MEYRRLPFEQYFINTSEDRNNTGKKTYTVVYTPFVYNDGGFSEMLKIEHEMNFEIHYEPDRDVIQINFQKTVGMRDWFVNVLQQSIRYYDAIDFEDEKLQLMVHHGWGNMYRSIKYDIRDSWEFLQREHPQAETEIVGWSLGASQAILCAQDLNYNFGLKPHLITFGSVSPFVALKDERQRMRRYLDTICKECWNFADLNDIISYLPPFRGAMMIRRVNVSTEGSRSLGRLLKPSYYHMAYDRQELYQDLEDGDTEETDFDHPKS
ncbi:MAG: hypothetical protein IJS38_01235 [Erysipelotrichaceae bacterium]|nr:hypothetical protein [Erysipelotrichaceae bacterium]